MTRRVVDQDGARWPVTGRTCSVCRMPADPSLPDGVHPMCAPSRTLDDAELANTIAMATTALGAELIGSYSTRWIRAGEPIRDLAPTDPDRVEAS